MIIKFGKSLRVDTEKHKSFITYTLVGLGVSGINIFLLYLFIDILNIPTLISSTLIIGGTFILKFYIYKWTGFAR